MSPERGDMRKRRAARVLLFEPGGRILLIRFVIARADGEFCFWAAPGGEIEGAETELQAAEREIREELGLELEMDGPVRVDRNSFELRGEMVDNTDFYFRAECGMEAPRLAGVTAEEIEIMKGMRWWTPEELEATGERVFPVDLVELVRGLQGG